MVFLTLICPGCQKSTVIDDDDEDLENNEQNPKEE